MKKIKDGEIDKDKFEKGALMFLLKESNTSDGQVQNEDFFWFSEVVKAKSSGLPYGDNSSAKRSASTYYNLLSKICEKLGYDIRKCSYVNLNPLGGGKKQSNEYKRNAENYFSNTKEKISKLFPKAIICCGTYEIFMEHISVEETVKPDNGKSAVIKIGEKKIMVIKGKHPIDRNVDNATIIEQVTEEYIRLSSLF